MSLMRRDRWLLRIEYEGPDGWSSAGTEFRVRRKPVVSEDLAATAYVIWIGDWMKHVEGRRKYRAALYRIGISGRVKLVWSCSIPPGGWGVEGYAPVDWPSGHALTW